jgi:hypothetical protein
MTFNLGILAMKIMKNMCIGFMIPVSLVMCNDFRITECILIKCDIREFNYNVLMTHASLG